MIGYLNIKSLRNKAISIREITQKTPKDFSFQIKLSLIKAFPDSQVKTDEYQYYPFRINWNCKGFGKIIFVNSWFGHKIYRQYLPMTK